MIKLFTVAHRRPDFIGLQFQSFQKHLQEPFEFVVFNNAVFDIDKNNYEKIKTVCSKIGIQAIDIVRTSAIEDPCQVQESVFPSLFLPNGTYSNANIACAYPLCWAWKTHICWEKTPICFLESDMFLMAPIKLSDFLQGYDIGFHPMQYRLGDRISDINMHSGMILTNPSLLPSPETMDWYCGTAKGIPVDVGGQTYKYLQAHPGLRQLHIGATPTVDEADFTGIDYEWYSISGNPIVLHYRAGSNWNQKSAEYHEKKTKWLQEKLA
jgi:hypothetical protein